MARDLNIKGTAGIVDTDKYVYRKERDMTKTQVDWNAVTTGLTDTINKIRDDRESRKAEIEKKTRETMNQLQDLEQYDNQSLNSKIIGMGGEAGNYIQSQNDLMRRGLISPSEFLQNTQNVQDNFKNVKNAFAKFDKDFQNAQLRVQNNESNIAEQYEMEGIAGFGNLANMDYYVNPTTGTLSFVKKQFDPETGEPIPMTDEYLADPANHLSMNTINVRLNSKSNYQSTSEAVSSEVEKLGEIVTVDPGTRQSVTTYEDWFQLEGSEELMNDLIGTVINNDQQKISVLQDMGYTTESFTQDPAVAAEDPSKILMIPAKDGSGRLVPQFNEEQEAEMEQYVRNRFAAQISKKAGFTKGTQPVQSRPKTATEIGRDDRERDRTSLYQNNVDLVTGDGPLATKAATQLTNIYNNNRGDKPEITSPITRTIGDDGEVIFTIPFEDGVQTVSSLDPSGNVKTPEQIVDEIYDISNPYGDNINIGKDAWKGSYDDLSTGTDKASGSIKFKTIDEIDYTSPVQIGGANVNPVDYLENILDENFDDGVNANKEDIQSSFSKVIEQLMPPIMADNVKFRVVATDADGGEEFGGNIKFFFTGPDGKEAMYQFKDTNNKSIRQAYDFLKQSMNKERTKYNKNKKSKPL
ncbi:MAG: hypothetical protein GOVbin1629_30 [Prokaryotic dsDNA virus sp.]|nr:MAG: hypothetical protein GOVbin1629_30 [Prokaryotic dsDNA virus sp.]|tara:strand:- start:19894 stop:21804 length:1911 start_codon:yes stop_codon:yes gene_type:complete